MIALLAVLILVGLYLAHRESSRVVREASGLAQPTHVRRVEPPFDFDRDA